MTEQTIKPSNIVALTQQGRATDQEIKDEAFRLWIELGRSWMAVSRYTGIPDSTLRNWGNVEQWEIRRQNEANSFLPGMLTETNIALRMSSYRAAVRMQQLVFESERDNTPLDLKQIQALSIVVDRGGHSPTGNKQPVEVNLGNNDGPMTAIDLSGKSPDELSRLEDSHRSKRKTITTEDGRRPPR